MADSREQFAHSLIKFLELMYGDINDVPLCKSPIEAMMSWGLSAAAGIRGPNSFLTLDAQKQIGDYKVDFLVALTTWTEPKFFAEVIVECDGHDFHEKTKEQASRDKERDRTLQQLGYNVFRFSGSDIWKDVMACANEVIEFLEVKIEGQEIDHAQKDYQRYLAK